MSISWITSPYFRQNSSGVLVFSYSFSKRFILSLRLRFLKFENMLSKRSPILNRMSLCHVKTLSAYLKEMLLSFSKFNNKYLNDLHTKLL